MTTAPRRIGRTYTAARRHPTVFGRIGEWQLPFGPYTPLQLSVAFLGAFALIKSFSWWASALGPLPIVAWAVAVWAVRGTRIAGRDPLAAVLGWASLLIRPREGRIGGRTARTCKSHSLHGGFVIEAAPDTPPVPTTTPIPAPVKRRGSPRPVPAAPARQRPTRTTPHRPRPVASPTAPASPSSSSAAQSVAPGPLSPLQQLLATTAPSSRSSS